MYHVVRTYKKIANDYNLDVLGAYGRLVFCHLKFGNKIIELKCKLKFRELEVNSNNITASPPNYA